MKLNDYYHDRGIKKYMGFFLSEHTSTIQRENEEYLKYNEGKEEMDLSDIKSTLNVAILKNYPVSIQLNLRMMGGHGFIDDIKGFIEGYEHDAVLVDDTKIYIDMIRHVELEQVKKWY